MRSSIATPRRALRPGTGSAEPAALRWSALTYRVPAGPSRPRVALWRTLQRRRALNLELGTWAVGHDEDGRVDLDDVVTLVAEAGGRCSVDEVVAGRPDAARLETQLRRACDRLWDAFFNECDHVFEQVTELQDRRQVEQHLDGLRRAFIDVRRRDLLLTGGAGDRARRRLAGCYELLDPDEDATTVIDERFSDLLARRSCFASPVHCRPATDGTVTYLAVVSPHVPVRWELAFAVFEASVYLPADDRIPLEHGMFTVRCDPADRASTFDGLTRRLRVFAQARS